MARNVDLDITMLDVVGLGKMRALRILNAAYHQLHIITYDQLLLRAKQLLGFSDQSEDEEDYDFLPF